MVHSKHSSLDLNLFTQFNMSLQRLAEDPLLSGELHDSLCHLMESFQAIEKMAISLDDQSNYLQGLTETSSLINSTLQIDEILNQVMDTIIQLSGAERCFLALKNDGGLLEIRIARNWIKESLQSEDIQFSNTVIQQVIQHNQPVVTTNAQMDERFAGQKSVMMHHLRAILCVPFMARETCIGVIYADNRIRSGIFTSAILDQLVPFANQAAVAIENARLFQQIKDSLAEVKSLKQMMDNVFASIPSGVLTTDLDFQVTLQNKSAISILGKDPSVTGSYSLKDILGISESQFAAVYKMHHTEESVSGLEIQIDHPKLGSRDVRLSISPLHDENQSTMGTVMVFEDTTEQKRLEASKALFERMVSPAVITQLQGKSFEIGGERKTISILFADMRGFTHYCEHHSPEAVVEVLNRYLGAAANAILEEGGTIDKFMGDAVMAWFNAPIAQGDHLIRAIRSALAIQDVTRQINLSLPQTEQLSFGIGIHTGEAVLGLIGALKRMDYTAIGDCINTARRIQEHAAAGQILLSQEVMDSLTEHICVTPMPAFYAKGKTDPVMVYELRSLSADCPPGSLRFNPQ